MHSAKSTLSVAYCPRHTQRFEVWIFIAHHGSSEEESVHLTVGRGVCGERFASRVHTSHRAHGSITCSPARAASSETRNTGKEKILLNICADLEVFHWGGIGDLGGKTSSSFGVKNQDLLLRKIKTSLNNKNRQSKVTSNSWKILTVTLVFSISEHIITQIALKVLRL